MLKIYIFLHNLLLFAYVQLLSAHPVRVNSHVTSESIYRTLGRRVSPLLSPLPMETEGRGVEGTLFADAHAVKRKSRRGLNAAG